MMLNLKPKKIILIVFLFGILLSSGTIFNLSSGTSFSHLTDKNMKKAFAQTEDNYYSYDEDYNFNKENSYYKNDEKVQNTSMIKNY